jgi:Transposase DDE domain
VARQKADELAKTTEFAVALRKRRKVEALFSELKNLIGLRRLRLRRLKFVREQFYLAGGGPKHQATGAVPQHESATSDGNRVRNKLPQEKHEPEETP